MKILHNCKVPDNEDRPPQQAPIGAIAYQLQGLFLHEQLSVGASVVLACITPPQMRRGWQQIAAEHGARFWAVETVCSDRDLHRRRFEERPPTVIGDWQLTWEFIEETMRNYAPWPAPHIVADAVGPVEDNVAAIVEQIRSAPSE